MRNICFRVWDNLNRLYVAIGHDVVEYMDSPRYVVEQFTGKRDKYNRKIFAGDLIGSSVEDSLWIVEYSDARAAFTISHGGRTLLLGDFADTEVISNIHMNGKKISYLRD